MATTKKRVNVSLPKDLEIALKHLAKRDDVPQSTKAMHLIKIAIEIDEDLVFDGMATKRDTKNAKFLSHNQAWQ